MSNRKQIWTNGLWVIEAEHIIKRGNLKDSRLIGRVIDINNKHKYVSGSAYTIGSKIDFPLYHTMKSKEPQFRTIEQVIMDSRNEKIDSIL